MNVCVVKKKVLKLSQKALYKYQSIYAHPHKLYKSVTVEPVCVF